MPAAIDESVRVLGVKTLKSEQPDKRTAFKAMRSRLLEEMEGWAEGAGEPQRVDWQYYEGPFEWIVKIWVRF